MFQQIIINLQNNITIINIVEWWQKMGTVPPHSKYQSNIIITRRKARMDFIHKNIVVLILICENDLIWNTKLIKLVHPA